MGKDVLSERSVMVVKVDEDRPSTTTASGATATAKGKNAFRFPRFSLKSPSMGSAATAGASSASPTNGTGSRSRRLRNFPLLRLRSLPVDVSETSVNTSLSPSPQAPSGSSESSSSSSASQSSNSEASGSRRRRKQKREAREDYVIRCTKVYSVQNSSTGEQGEGQADQDDQEQQHQDTLQSSSPSHPCSPASIAEEDQPEIVGDYEHPTNESQSFTCATAILQHSYLEMVCGKPGYALADEDNYTEDVEAIDRPHTPSPSNRRRIPDDPTVQDSIECVFASQLEEGLALWADDEDDDDLEEGDEHRDEQEEAPLPNLYTEEPINAPSEAELPSPAPLMQSRQKSRRPLPSVAKAMIPNKRRSHPSNNTSDSRNGQAEKEKQQKLNGSTPLSSPSRRRKKCQTAKMVHVGTFDPRTNRILEVAETDHNLMEEDPVVRVAPVESPPRSAKGCFCHSNSVPIVPDSIWPQAPLLLRPTPNEGMCIKGVRFSGKTEHLWKPSDGGWWLTPLYELAGKDVQQLPPDVPAMCSQCCLLPINNGNEPVGEALVTDFETPLFEGSLLVRLRHVDGGATNTDPKTMEYDDNVGYFAGLNRRYQVVIRGKFKSEIPYTDLFAGMVMNRPYGRLPPKWIMKGAIKVLSFFAPQLQVELDGPRPKTMAPLGSTPQALIVQEVGPNDVLAPLDGEVEEPVRAAQTLLGVACPGATSLQRARGRKKAFDKLFSSKTRGPMTKTDTGSKETYYTFEFLQHLVNFQDFSVELGNLLGSIPIAPIFAGAPIPIMAMVKEGEQKLWSFDLWHQSLVEGAKEFDAQNGNEGGNKQ
ncbi:expressed unknown protein [Seminavis robusta]|uniref:Domain of unknown function at the cortex 1 domain-containing protein n=1 Tax=Seminavis robusta TaxID=568900 RepID=A0A9N8H5A9_9STRA|nr:expressed unknown protein [Seminavis robusta]|eukprot:Sro20_g014360.1 n/a (817) ;mRNA; f:149794-152244